jgi:hypothetical protein
MSISKPLGHALRSANPADLDKALVAARAQIGESFSAAQGGGLFPEGATMASVFQRLQERLQAETVPLELTSDSPDLLQWLLYDAMLAAGVDARGEWSPAAVTVIHSEYQVTPQMRGFADKTGLGVVLEAWHSARLFAGAVVGVLHKTDGAPPVSIRSAAQEMSRRSRRVRNSIRCRLPELVDLYRPEYRTLDAVAAKIAEVSGCSVSYIRREIQGSRLEQLRHK